jgi:tRNA A-37 threonylcarbamoyl transferase component Bud32
LKQARPQLRVPDPWFSDVERIWREVEVLEISERALLGVLDGTLFPESRFPQAHRPDTWRNVADPIDRDIQPAPVRLASFDKSGGWGLSIPAVLFVDQSNYLFAMTAVPAHESWKRKLLDGDCDPAIASACGELLGLLHASTWNDPVVADRIADRRFFEQLRVDPYYRHVARARPDMAFVLDALIDSLDRHPRCLVHGDFSPKNILVSDHMLTLVDCEVGHFGDPAFDLGFFLSHLVLKSYHFGPRWSEYMGLTFAFWEQYDARMRSIAGPNEFDALVTRGILNLAGCMLARVDGKSKVEYLQPTTQGIVRAAAESLLHADAATWLDAVAVLAGRRSAG